MIKAALSFGTPLSGQRVIDTMLAFHFERARSYLNGCIYQIVVGKWIFFYAYYFAIGHFPGYLYMDAQGNIGSESGLFGAFSATPTSQASHTERRNKFPDVCLLIVYWCLSLPHPVLSRAEVSSVRGERESEAPQSSASKGNAAFLSGGINRQNL
jgi:hypothetical protein